tara:strand:- start:239 stop:457 length:219 start_codon:yes stop_codon:yes gene_type:complete
VLRESGLKMGPRYRIKARAEGIMGRLVKVMAPTASAAVGVGGSTIRLEVGDRALVGVNPDAGPLVACTCACC